MKENKRIQLAREHYTAQATIVWCFDHRGWEAFLKFLEEHRILNFDLISVAGGIKDLASPAKESDREFMLRQIITSVNLHHNTEKVVIANHQDCGGYGGSQKCGGTLEKEIEFHVGELERAATEIKKVLPHLPIERVVLTFGGAVMLD